MANDSGLADDRFRAEPPERKKSGWSTCLTGCLIALAVLVILVVAIGIYAWLNWRNWAATAGSQFVKQGIQQSQLPAQEKQEVNEQVDRIADEFRSGRMSMEQVSKIMQELVNSPLMTSFVASAIDREYLANSGLNNEEKAEGKSTLRRFMRGAIDKKIDEQALNAAMAHVADRQPNGNWELKKQISDDELRKFLEVAKAESDKAGIADEPEDFDPSDEIKRIVDEAMKP